MIHWSDIVRSGLAAVRAHRLRSALTALGILIGIASVILTVGLGLGAQEKVNDQISALGSNLLIVSPGSSTGTDGIRGGFGSGTTLTTADATAIVTSQATPDVKAVVPVHTSSLVASSSGTSWTTSVSGTTTAWPDVRNRTLDSGRFFTQAEADAGALVTVLAPDTSTEIFGSTNSVGQTVTIAGRQLTVIGVLAKTGASGTSASENDMALMPLSTAYAVTGSTSTSVSTIYVQSTSKATLAAAYQEVQALLTNVHGVTASSRDFSIATQASLIQTANETNRTMTILLAGIAAISLLVGGIGVMNIMLVSVSERIREIGLRKALGAAPRLIRRQFLMEAGILGLAGGILGLGIAALGAWLLPKLISQPVTMSLWASAGALVVAVGIGLIAGVYPATRAARLAPIDALRRE